ncbi:MAG: glycine--tRNA ligase subunit beta, partial [bacterium]|nr:glycine--tRNA ligase subunit beta [bacterium]
MSDFLFELGVEEVPVSRVPPLLDQLTKKLEARLKDSLVEFKYLETAATNRRFMIYINQINDKANDVEEEIKGPPKRIAYDQEGNPAIALSKFMESNGVQAGDLMEIETKKGVYMAIRKQTTGRPTIEILQDIMPKILGELTFAKAMLWNSSRVPFVRPIKGILALQI